MSTNQILFGLGLVLVLAVSSQLLARLLTVPALVVLLPAGFIAGIATDDVHPDALLGSLYPHYQLPIPSMAVVEFELDPSQTELTDGHVVPRGTAIETEPIDGEPCRFRTCYDATLWPLAAFRRAVRTWAVGTRRTLSGSFPQPPSAVSRTKCSA